MESTELRMGNLINYKSNTVIVTGIGEYGITAKDGERSVINARFATPDIEPIPLTSEWLERLGFEIHANKSTDRYWRDQYLYSEGGLFIHFSMDEGDKFVPCKYAHQLQNLYFALTGTELEVKQVARK